VTSRPAGDVEAFRAEAVAFLADAQAAGIACPAYGAILPPALHDRARAWQRHMADAGFAGIHWPVAYGGRGLSRSHTAAWLEECARAQVSPYLNLQGLVLAGEAILRSGTDEQRGRFLPPTLTGELLWCQLFSEPGAGSDLTSLTTSAVADGDRYVVDGAKVWSSNAQHADHGILLARTDPAQQGHRGISFFLLDMATPGVEVRPIRQMTGDQEFCAVFLDGVAVPAAARLGPENDGWRVATEVLLDERGSSGAGLVSLERRLDHLRTQAGQRPAQRDTLLRLYVRGQALRMLLVRGGDGGPAASSSAKLLRTELEFDIELALATLRGPDALLAGPATDRFLYAPGMRIAGGTSEIQRNIIGERVLGLPREPR
jgi:alkylation response protein AidB-like acyl-CoA dehydrogenase